MSGGSFTKVWVFKKQIINEMEEFCKTFGYFTTVPSCVHHQIFFSISKKTGIQTVKQHSENPVLSNTKI